MRSALNSRALAIAAAIAALACRDPTQITVELTTDAECADVQGTNLTTGRLESLEDSPPSLQTSTCSAQRIGSVVLVPSGENDGRVALRVVTGINKSPEACIADDFTAGGGMIGCIVAWRSLRYVPHSSLVMPIAMKLDCLNVPCAQGSTCLGGVCVSAEVEDPESACLGGDCLPGLRSSTPNGGDPVCGNAVPETGEECDDGDDVTNVCPTSEPCTVCQQGCVWGPGSATPGSAEICGDAQDNDGDGRIDEPEVCGCEGATVDCSGECFDLTSSAQHCGDCDTACAGDQSCQGGSCVDDCQDETIGAGDYSFCSVPLSWEDAASACSARGMQLARIDDAAEDAAILASSQARIGGADATSWPWIGGSDLLVTGEWRWPDGEMFYEANALTCTTNDECPNGTCSNGSCTDVSLYINWALGEPLATEHCAVLQSAGAQGQWSAAACADPQPYVCEL